MWERLQDTLVPAISTALTLIVGGLGLYVRAYLMAKTAAINEARGTAVAGTIVAAVEQVLPGATGGEKKDLAMRLADEVPAPVTGTQIEAAVAVQKIAAKAARAQELYPEPDYSGVSPDGGPH